MASLGPSWPCSGFGVWANGLSTVKTPERQTDRGPQTRRMRPPDTLAAMRAQIHRITRVTNCARIGGYASPARPLRASRGS